MILMPDLFSFAYVPNWYSQLDMLAEMALPEPWRFKNPIYLTKNPDTPILERYIHAIFKKQLIDYTSEQALYRLLRLFSKVRARSRRCSSAPNRTRCAAHAVAPPLQTEPAALGFGLVFFDESHKFCIATCTKMK